MKVILLIVMISQIMTIVWYSIKWYTQIILPIELFIFGFIVAGFIMNLLKLIL